VKSKSAFLSMAFSPANFTGTERTLAFVLETVFDTAMIPLRRCCGIRTYGCYWAQAN